MIKSITAKIGQPRTAEDNLELGAITVAETLIALGVGATVLAAVFAGVPALIESRNASSGLSGLAQIATSIRATFGGRNDFDGLTTELAADLSGFPRNFISGTNVRHPWGGDIAIAGNGQNFTVTFEDMPSNGCSSMVAASVDIAETVSIGGTEVDLAPDDENTAPTNIGNLCSASTPPDVAWVFSS